VLVRRAGDCRIVIERKQNRTGTGTFFAHQLSAGVVLDKNRIKGAAHEVKGAVKEAVGKVTGDKKTQAEGVAEKAGGKVERAAGNVKDAVKGR
jgi:uncharacterized protein YjbJ (UPF0337 family)